MVVRTWRVVSVKFASTSLAAGILLTFATAHAADQKSVALLHEALKAQGASNNCAR